MSKSVLPVFSSRSFIVLGLTVRSLIYFEFMFVFLLPLTYSFDPMTQCCWELLYHWKVDHSSLLSVITEWVEHPPCVRDHPSPLYNYLTQPCELILFSIEGTEMGSNLNKAPQLSGGARCELRQPHSRGVPPPPKARAVDPVMPQGEHPQTHR